MNEAHIQKNAFLEGEGDSWFERNADHLQGSGNDVVVGSISKLRLRPTSILEIGSANGHRLATLAKNYDCKAAGVEPSSEAVRKGLDAYPNLNLHVGTADALPFADCSFDMVIIGFCMYLIDPTLHMRAAAEADRVLADGGTLIVFDFQSAKPYHNVYSHLPGLRAHKMDFARLFLAHPAYSLVHRELAQKVAGFLEPDWREGVDVLIKDVEGAFPPNFHKR
jgi:SAM-dependent methyltransferase